MGANLNMFLLRNEKMIKAKKPMDKETYHIEIKVRDENGKILKSKDKGLPEPTLQCELTAKDNDQLEHKMKQMAKVMRAWIPTGYSIDLEASVYMNVSGDAYYMAMFSFYESENRFVKH